MYDTVRMGREDGTREKHVRVCKGGGKKVSKDLTVATWLNKTILSAFTNCMYQHKWQFPCEIDEDTDDESRLNQDFLIIARKVDAHGASSDSKINFCYYKQNSSESKKKKRNRKENTPHNFNQHPWRCIHMRIQPLSVEIINKHFWAAAQSSKGLKDIWRLSKRNRVDVNMEMILILC